MEQEKLIDISKWVKNIDESLKIKLDEFVISHMFMKLGTIRLTKNKRILWDIFIEDGCQNIYSRYENGIYLITFNDYIIKIGGTKVGMKGRICSYQCGHCIPERKKKNGLNYPGKMSVTNAYIYNTIYQYLLEERGKFEIYYYSIEDIVVQKEIFGKMCEFKVQCYDEYEKKALEIYKSQVGEFPILSDNSHP